MLILHIHHDWVLFSIATVFFLFAVGLHTRRWWGVWYGLALVGVFYLATNGVADWAIILACAAAVAFPIIVWLWRSKPEPAGAGVDAPAHRV